jgi:hypothetical protein
MALTHPEPVVGPVPLVTICSGAGGVRNAQFGQNVILTAADLADAIALIPGMEWMAAVTAAIGVINLVLDPF